MDYAVLRKKMVEEQLIARGIRAERICNAFLKVERHRFVPEEERCRAYEDYPLPIGEGQTISQPYIVALMTESLALSGGERVLEIGAGSGYQAAILAECGARVYSMERIPVLAQRASSLLGALGYTGVSVRVGDGTLGWAEEAPFDRIVVTAATPHVPAPLASQLATGGTMVLPLGEQFGQVLTVIEKDANGLTRRQVCGCVFVPLLGRYGQKEGGG